MVIFLHVYNGLRNGQVNTFGGTIFYFDGTWYI